MSAKKLAQQDKILTLSEDGYSPKEIAYIINLTPQRVYQIIKSMGYKLKRKTSLVR